MKTQWLKICEDLQNRLNPGTYKVWVAPLTADLEGEGKIRLSAPNGFVATWVRDRLLNDISDAASAIFGRTMEISVVAGNPPAKPSRSVPGRPAVSVEGEPAPSRRPRTAPAPRPVAAPSLLSSAAEQLSLPITMPVNQSVPHNWRYAFDSFVVGPTNDMAYAAARNIQYRKGKTVELLASYEPAFTMMNEWYKQLFGESEGKDQKGLMPTSCIFSTDLHSMGQFLQDGSRTMFETYVDIKNTREDFYIEPLEGNFDGLNFLADQNMSVVNRKAMEGTILAHNDGGVPIGVIEVDSLDAYNVGYLIYFFWKACAVSGYLLSVNPFDQPGVESYKKNMFALLGKPGYEDMRAALLEKLGK